MLCSKCNNFVVYIQKCQLCKRCYKQREYAADRERILLQKKEFWKANGKRIEQDRIRSKKRESVESRYRALIGKAKFDDRECDIDLETYRELITQPCKYCDGPLNKTGVGLDRKDSSKGYLSMNVVPCCFKCNRVKGDTLTHDEMRIAMDAIMRYRKTGKI